MEVFISMDYFFLRRWGVKEFYLSIEIVIFISKEGGGVKEFFFL